MAASSGYKHLRSGLLCEEHTVTVTPTGRMMVFDWLIGVVIQPALCILALWLDESQLSIACNDGPSINLVSNSADNTNLFQMFE